MPRKVMLQMHMSIDGYIAGPNNELIEWIIYNFSQDLNDYLSNIKFNDIILGRKLAEGFIPAWESMPSSTPGRELMVNTPKMVFSTTLQENPWGERVRLLNSGFEDEVGKMKAQDGSEGDVMVYGGVQTVQALIEKGLVDELFLLVEPVALGEGKKLFSSRTSYEVIETKKFECGIVVLHYRKKV